MGSWFWILAAMLAVALLLYVRSAPTAVRAARESPRGPGGPAAVTLAAAFVSMLAVAGLFAVAAFGRLQAGSGRTVLCVVGAAVVVGHYVFLVHPMVRLLRVGREGTSGG